MGERPRGEREIDHYFCTKCGIQPFMRSTLDELGGEFYCVNVACLEGVDDRVLAAASIAYEDGRNDEWRQAPAEVGYL